ncbi:HesA/MoeB/ThiF family protein [Ktedonospora formicarum]|uniref:THIF-type NAD/FAD binding fold domain-containing protein n=1 Tax=Ktedonospora formicarum TaxID=2778364 RepID=A0A8J3I3Z1_9CHLR|nr:ThiF family adenylyltransferase [Ktedonospora formicarum]GHO45543.1 hypothetical protein KSX_37060 [Ktedonospora formicarum]
MNHSALNANSPFFHEERHEPLEGVSDKIITMCGAGALGGNLCETLARMGFKRLRLIDKDHVEMRNLSTQPYTRGEIGTPKARALANSLYRAVQAKVEAHVIELTPENAVKLLTTSDLVIDTFDNHAGREAVSNTTRTLALPCLHVGFSGDGLYGSGLWEPDYLVPQATQGDPCDYPLTRPFALVLTSLAVRAICHYLRLREATNFEFTWRDLNVTKSSRNW